ncbi:MAG: hypothetical protein ACO3O3_11475 [Ilumatobacteraceae bacterium]
MIVSNIEMLFMCMDRDCAVIITDNGELRQADPPADGDSYTSEEIIGMAGGAYQIISSSPHRVVTMTLSKRTAVCAMTSMSMKVNMVASMLLGQAVTGTVVFLPEIKYD